MKNDILIDKLERSSKQIIGALLLLCVLGIPFLAYLQID